MSDTLPRVLPARTRFAIELTGEQLLWAASLFFALVANRSFLGDALRGRAAADAATWGFGLGLVVLLTTLHYLLLAPLAHRRVLKPLLAVLVVLSALASFYMQEWGVYLDPTMVRNALRTDLAEARELLGVPLFVHLLVYAALPLVLLGQVQLQRRRWPRGLGLRLVAMAAAALVFVGTLVAVYQPFSSLMRNQSELRYRVTPANLLWSLAAVTASQSRAAAGPRQPIGLDASPGQVAQARSQGRARPLLVVLVVGETARAANWGLSGYGRDTTPQLARLPVLNWPQVQACGTNTETSVPCLFAPVGRRDYDEARIRGSESLLHVAARGGVDVHWRDNQSGCKGVCDGLPADDVPALNPAGLCRDGHCLDEGLLAGLDERVAALQQRGGTQLLVLHQLGNHGPAYHRRYPTAFARFAPACEQDDLHLCERQAIVNAYDNALLYTDHVLATLVARLTLAARQQAVDTAMLYVSDHGESLGENNLYLHGLPYAIAPDVQKQVPMVLWLAPALRQALGDDCLAQRVREPAAHDHVFHTLLGLLDVKTTLHEPALDLLAPCRRPR